MEDREDEEFQRGRRRAIEELLARAAPPTPPPRLVEEARSLSREASQRPTPRKPLPRKRTGLGKGSLVADRYRIEAEIGRGGVGTVYRATDSKFDVQVALKVASATGEAIHEFKSRFQREARISYLIGKAPGLVRALDWGVIEEDRSLYLALDLVKGARPLDLRNGPLDARLERLAAAASLVARVHRQGIVHRDIKPGNFLVSNKDRIHLSDFGTAKALREAPGEEEKLLAPITRSGLIIGTPLYMSPEQFNDPRHVGRPADVYALGVMLYHCLVGRFPYEGGTVVEFLANQLQARYGLVPAPPRPRELDPDTPLALDDLCMSSLELDADLRPPTARAFLKLLRAHLDGDPTVFTPTDTERWSWLGLDADGFTTLSALRAFREEMGGLAYSTLFKNKPALLVTKERAVQGMRHYEGRLALLVCRPPGPPLPVVTLGRTEDADIALRLASISKRHVKFLQSGQSWSVVDEGSHNGTTCNGQALKPNQPHPLESGDRLCLSEHLILEFLLPADLERRVQAPS